MIVFACSSGAIGFSPSDTWLVAWRAVQGVGAALMMPATLSIITNAFPPAERGKAIGTWAGVSAMALAIGPVVGGFLVQSVSWQSIFFLNLPVAVGAVLVALFAVRESRDETVAQRVDVPGVLTLTIGLAALVLALVEGNAWHWGSARELALFAVAAAGPGSVRGRRAPPAGADGRLQLLPLAHVPRRQHRRLHRQLRDARDVLLHGPLHAERPPLHARCRRACASCPRP